MSHYYSVPLVDADELAEAKRMIGPDFVRIIGYFQEDGVKAIVAIEQALQARSATAMVLPAHKLKGEARQLGALRLGDIAEAIEATARTSIEKQTTPDEVASEVSMLRSCFAETMNALAPQAQPVRAPAQSPGMRPLGGRPGTFGRRVSAN